MELVDMTELALVDITKCLVDYLEISNLVLAGGWFFTVVVLFFLLKGR